MPLDAAPKLPPLPQSKLEARNDGLGRNKPFMVTSGTMHCLVHGNLRSEYFLSDLELFASLQRELGAKVVVAVIVNMPVDKVRSFHALESVNKYLKSGALLVCDPESRFLFDFVCKTHIDEPSRTYLIGTSGQIEWIGGPKRAIAVARLVAARK